LRGIEAKHNPLGAGPEDTRVCFEAYISTFQSTRPTDGRALGIPLWVGYEVDRGTAPAEKHERPKWYTVKALVDQKLAPTEASYAFTVAFRAGNPNWYERGHLAPKFLAERINQDAARYTHNVVNAVPQRGRFNRGPWYQLECETGAWANEYGSIWVIAGPVFLDGRPTAWLDPGGVMPVAIPDALFKIIARRVADPGDEYVVLAFIYPQDSPSYANHHWDDREWRTTVERVEALTGLSLIGSSIRFVNTPTEQLWPLRQEDFDPKCAHFARDSSTNEPQ
jgi:endonuclease G